MESIVSLRVSVFTFVCFFLLRFYYLLTSIDIGATKICDEIFSKGITGYNYIVDGVQHFKLNCLNNAASAAAVQKFFSPSRLSQKKMFIITYTHMVEARR